MPGTSLGIVRNTAPRRCLAEEVHSERLPSSDTYEKSMSWPCGTAPAATAQDLRHVASTRVPEVANLIGIRSPSCEAWGHADREVHVDSLASAELQECIYADMRLVRSEVLLERGAQFVHVWKRRPCRRHRLHDISESRRTDVLTSIAASLACTCWYITPCDARW